MVLTKLYAEISCLKEYYLPKFLSGCLLSHKTTYIQ